jgi:hypothetical protein
MNSEAVRTSDWKRRLIAGEIGGNFWWNTFLACSAAISSILSWPEMLTAMGIPEFERNIANRIIHLRRSFVETDVSALRRPHLSPTRRALIPCHTSTQLMSALGELACLKDPFPNIPWNSCAGRAPFKVHPVVRVSGKTECSQAESPHQPSRGVSESKRSVPLHEGERSPVLQNEAIRSLEPSAVVISHAINDVCHSDYSARFHVFRREAVFLARRSIDR